MIVFMFAMFFLHKLYIFPLIVDGARWSANTLAGMGFEHAAYWAGLGWVPGNFVFWITWFAECLLLLILIPGLNAIFREADRMAKN